MLDIQRDWTYISTMRDSECLTIKTNIPTPLDILEGFVMWVEHSLEEPRKANNLRYVYGEMLKLTEENNFLKEKLKNA